MNTAASPRLADVMQGIANAIRMMECTATDGVNAGPPCTLAEMQMIFDQIRVLAHRLLDLVIPRQDTIQFVDVGDTIAAMARILHCTVGPEIELQLGIHDDIPPLMCDPGHLKGTILNILTNTRDMMTAGGDISLLAAREIQPLGGNFEEHYVLIQIESKSRTAKQSSCQIGHQNSTIEPPGTKDCSPISELAREFAWQLGGSIKVDRADEIAMTIALRLPARVARAGSISAAIERESA